MLNVPRDSDGIGEFLASWGSMDRERIVVTINGLFEQIIMGMHSYSSEKARICFIFTKICSPGAAEMAK